MNKPHIDTPKLLVKTLDSAKYRDLGVNQDTIQDLIQQEMLKYPTEKQLLKAVKRKLHNIVAPYLGLLDYETLMSRLSVIESDTIQSVELHQFCFDVLNEHASTAERLPYLESFYQTLFCATGKPATLIDLACGVNPLAFPWMDLAITTQYYAYDIIQPRVDFLNRFLTHIGLQPLAENRDILINPPQQHADLGLFFKEAHRFEKRQPGCNRKFWNSLNVDVLAVSLPVQNLSGSHNLIEQHRKLVYGNLPPNQGVSELLIQNEMVFLIENPGR